MTNVIKKIKETRIYGIIREDNTQKALEIANAYFEGGIRVIEVNSTLEAISEIAKNKEINIAQGGVITSAQAHQGIKAGAKLIVSPILQMSLVKLSSNYKIPLILSATTPNEAYTAWKARIPIIKIYPVTDLGGATYIEDLLKPMSFLNILPSGSIDFKDIQPYLKCGATAVGLGRALYKDKKYEEIVKSVKHAFELADKV